MVAGATRISMMEFIEGMCRNDQDRVDLGKPIVSRIASQTAKGIN